MAVAVTIAKGMDPSYPFRVMRGEKDGQQQLVTKGGGDYYLAAAERGGEPAGTWVGEGLAKLGIHDGDTVREDDFKPLYGDFQDLRDSTRQTYLGRPPREVPEAWNLYLQKVAAEPHATAERRQVLLIDARAEVPGGTVRFWDTTLSVDKTVSLAHASALAAAQEARESGKEELAAQWAARAAGIWEEIEAATRVYIAHQQRESGYVRTGHHGARRDGVEEGRFERAHDIPVAIFPQHTSRNGDPHLHVHVTWLNRVQTVSDGEWRAVDSRALHRNKQEGAALAAFALESSLTRRFGFDWAYSEKSKGRILTSVPQKVIDAFSSRRTQVSEETLRLIEEYKRDYGHDPDQRAVMSMRHRLAFYKDRPTKEGRVDFAALLRDWERKSRENEVGTLRELARGIWARVPGAAAPTAAQMEEWLQAQGIMTPAQERVAMAAGLAQVQQEKSVWGRPELVRCIAQNLPDHAAAAGPQAAVALLERLADRALAGEAGEPVRRLDAPEWPRVPDSLRRADGESIYRPHGTALYATAAQLSMEERMLAHAQERGVPRVAPDVAAKLLGEDPARMEEHLRAAKEQALDPDGRTRTGLRLDQATAAFLPLTSDRRTELIVGPAGTGKSFTGSKAAEAWQAAGLGRVYGVTMTSAGREVLAGMGIKHVYNTAQMLGHTEEARGTRGPVDIGPNALIIVDEATQTSMHDGADLLALASANNAKVLMIGDHAQIGAVESGGMFSWFARQLGYAQLTEAARFKADWEGRASLAIRDGEVSALAEYDQHGRLHGGSYEEMAEQAARAYVTEYLAGTNVVLAAYAHEERGDLARRVQGYLKDWDQLDTSVETALRDGAVAYCGDLIVATRNDNHLQAGEAGRHLVNTDVLRVDGIDGAAVTVQRLLEHDRESGDRIWSQPFTLRASYLAGHADLGYARTWHSVQGSTVSVGISLANDSRARSGVYPSLTRGELENHIYAYPAAQQPKSAGYGAQADPEIARARRLQAERNGEQAAAQPGDYDPVTVLARALRRDDQELSATETRAQALGNADHLGTLHFMWQEQVRAESSARFAQAVQDTLPAAEAQETLRDTDDLWRALRAAELTGRDGPATLREAVTQRDLAGAESISAVLTSRVREMTEHLPPVPRESWASRVRETGDPDRDRFVSELAAGMDGRQARLGRQAAEEQPLWARQALGAVPEDPARRQEWEARAGQIGAFREMFGYDHPGQAIGPEPRTTSPEARAEWHIALGVLAKIDGIDVRGLTDGQLLLRRQAYERETAWAPKYVGEELRLARMEEHRSRVDALRHDYEAAAAARRGDEEKAVQHRQTAAAYKSLGGLARQMADKFGEAQDTRRQWEAMTEPTRRLAVASDIELHRRGALESGDKLKSAEPQGFVYPAERVPADVWVQEKLDGGLEIARGGEPEQPESRTEEQQREALGLTLKDTQMELSPQVDEIAAYNRERQAKIDEMATMRVPAENEEEIDLGRAWSLAAERERGAVIQPPRPEIPPAQPVAAAATQRDMDMEAGQ